MADPDGVVSSWLWLDPPPDVVSIYRDTKSLSWSVFQIQFFKL